MTSLETCEYFIGNMGTSANFVRELGIKVLGVLIVGFQRKSMFLTDLLPSFCNRSWVSNCMLENKEIIFIITRFL